MNRSNQHQGAGRRCAVVSHLTNTSFRCERLEGRVLFAGDPRDLPIDFQLISATLSADKTVVNVQYSVSGVPADPGTVLGSEVTLWDRALPQWAYEDPLPDILQAPGDGPIDQLPTAFASVPLTNGVGSASITLARPYAARSGHFLFAVVDWTNFFRAEPNESNNIFAIGTPTNEKLDIQLAGTGLTSKFADGLAGVAFNYRVSSASFADSFDVGVYYSANTLFDAADVSIGSQTVAAPKSLDEQPGTIALASPLAADPARPYVLVVADRANAVTETSEKNNVFALLLPTVSVKVSGKLVDGKPTLDLFKTAKILPQLNAPLPKGTRVSSYSIDQRRSGDPNWHTIAAVVDAAPPSIVQRLAGDVEYRATVTINGNDFTTPDGKETHVEVRFPGIKDILKAKDVVFADSPPFSFKNFAALQFASALNVATEKARADVGLWLTIDTATGTYDTIAARAAVFQSDEASAFNDLGPRPADTFAADGLSGEYVIACMRIHSTYDSVDPAVPPRPVGPTPQELNRAGVLQDDVPLFVVDYVGHVVNGVRQIEPGWMRDGLFKVYTGIVFNPITGALVDRRQI
jgi:hypothetical protein